MKQSPRLLIEVSIKERNYLTNFDVLLPHGREVYASLQAVPQDLLPACGEGISSKLLQQQAGQLQVYIVLCLQEIRSVASEMHGHGGFNSFKSPQV